jgi:hypothetical protein
MIERDDDKILALQTAVGAAKSTDADELPYCVELWQADVDKVERVLARALSVQLARAIYTAALTEFPQRRITLRRGSEVILDSKE